MSRVAVISNVDWSSCPPKAHPDFTIRVHVISKPFVLVSGYRDCVPDFEQNRLQALARQIGESATNVLNALAEINAIAATHSHDYVSKDCWVTSQIADGRVRRSASLNLGQAGMVPQLFGGRDLSEWIRQNFRTAPGKELSYIQGAGAAFGPGDAKPLPPPFGEPRRFTVSGSSVAGVLRSPAGEHCGSIDIAQLECVLEARCNEEITEVLFAKVTLKGHPIAREFPKPLFPWPQVSPDLRMDQAPVPRGWEYSVGHWAAGNAYHLQIPPSSRSIRNVAFLGPEDEMVIVAPSTTLEFSWGESEQTLSTIVLARVFWRSRLDGTRG